MRVPWLFIVSAYVGRIVVTFPYIDKGVVQRITMPFQRARSRTGVPRNVADLSSVGQRIARIGKILRFLVGICPLYRKYHIMAKTEFQSGVQIHAANLHIAEVHHHPSILGISFRHGYNFVFHLIEISVRFHMQVHGAQRIIYHTECARIFHARVILRCLLRLQFGITHVGIVEVVECRHTESLLIESTDKQLFFQIGLIGEEYSRGETRFLRGGFWHLLVGILQPVAHHSAKHIGLKPYPLVVERRCCSRHPRVTTRENKISHIAVKVVVLPVATRCHLPKRKNFVS